jgi:hypothetical protein
MRDKSDGLDFQNILFFMRWIDANGIEALTNPKEASDTKARRTDTGREDGHAGQDLSDRGRQMRVETSGVQRRNSSIQG